MIFGRIDILLNRYIHIIFKNIKNNILIKYYTYIIMYFLN